MREGTSRGYRVHGTWSSEPVAGLERLNIPDMDAVEETLSRTRASVVAIAAAMAGVDECEARPDLARRVNAIAPDYIAELSNVSGARVVYFSTDYVFDGRSETVAEDGTPNPINVYGETKLAGELNVLSEAPGNLVIRTCANFGWNRLRTKENSVTRIINSLRKGNPVPLFTDQRVSPSYAPHVARVAFDLIDRRESGVYHVATRGCWTRFEVGEAVCHTFGLPTSLLKQSTLSEAGLIAPRPARSCLVSTRLGRFPDIPVPTFREALEDMRRSE